jgi:hypothetical protein
MYTHVCKCKNDAFATDSREGESRAAEGVNSSLFYLIHCKTLCKCYSVPPPSITIIQIKKEY